MSLISIPNIFTVGAVIVASQHNSNFSTIFSDYNGNITDANISASANISDTKLGNISTAGKVSGAALVTLGSIPTGAGTIPAKNGGTGADLSAALIGADPYFSATGVMSALAAGTLGQVKVSQAGAAPVWANALASVSDYGTSSSTATARQATALKVAFGSAISVGAGSSTAVTNLPFTSSTSYTVIVSAKSSFGTPPAGTDQNSGNLVANMDSGAQFTIYNTDDQTKTVNWWAVGI